MKQMRRNHRRMERKLNNLRKQGKNPYEEYLKIKLTKESQNA